MALFSHQIGRLQVASHSSMSALIEVEKVVAAVIAEMRSTETIPFSTQPRLVSEESLNSSKVSKLN